MSKARKTIEVDFRDELVSTTLRRRDTLITHRKKCRRALNCPKCALLQLHESLADLRFAINHARSAKVPPHVIFREAIGVVAGGV
jgi:hypothetical protein